MPVVNTTLEKFIKFLKAMKNDEIKEKAYDKIRQTLKRSLDENVFGHKQHEGNVFEIPTQTELELLIIGGGRSHKPSQPREAHYSKEYLKKKEVLNLPAHEYKNKGFVEGTEVVKETDRVIIRTPSESTTSRGYNYGPIHESKKSVLKYAVLSAWQDIIEDIIETYVDEVK